MSTVAELRTNVRTKLNETPTTRLSNAAIDAATKRGYSRIVRLTRCLRTEPLTAKTVKDQYAYALSAFGTSSAGGRIFEVTNLWCDSKARDYIDFDAMNRRYPDYPYEAVGSETVWSMRDARTIVLLPIPTVADVTIAIDGFATPDVSTWVDATTPTALHEDYHELIEDWACATLETGLISDEQAVWRNNYFGQQFVGGLDVAKREMAQAHGQLEMVGAGSMFGSRRIAVDESPI